MHKFKSSYIFTVNKSSALDGVYTILLNFGMFMLEKFLSYAKLDIKALLSFRNGSLSSYRRFIPV